MILGFLVIGFIIIIPMDLILKKVNIDDGKTHSKLLIYTVKLIRKLHELIFVYLLIYLF